MDMKRIFLYAIVIAALALAGCGGNGGGGGTTPGGDNGTMGPDPAAQLSALIAALGTAGLNVTADSTAADIQAQLATMTTNARNAVLMAMRTALGLTGNEDQAMIVSRIMEIRDMLPPSEDDDPAATKAAGTKRMAIAAEAAQAAADDAGLGGSAVTATGNSEGAYNLAIKRDRTSTTVTVTVEGATDAADEDFMQAEVIDGSTTMHTRTMEADANGNVMTEVAMVTTDIEAPKATAFGMVHELNIRVDGVTATEAMPNDALSVVDANLNHVKATAFTAPAGTPAGSTVVLPFQQMVADNPSTADVDEARAAAEIMGTYEGAMGTYKCNAATACSVTVNAMGEVTALSGQTDWIFIPATGATVDVADSDYLHYGFWLKNTRDSNGVLTYNEVETFAGSSVDASGDVSNVRGSATYSGGATGVYVRNVTGQDAAEILARSGHFRADASLMATFGQVHEGDDPADTGEPGTIAPNMLNTLTGTIDNFRLSDDSNLRPGWSVALDGDITPSDGTVSGTAKGGVANQDGSFSATFHGSVTAAADGSVPKPGSVVGEFNSVFSNGSVAGAFGARRNP